MTIAISSVSCRHITLKDRAQASLGKQAVTRVVTDEFGVSFHRDSLGQFTADASATRAA